MFDEEQDRAVWSSCRLVFFFVIAGFKNKSLLPLFHPHLHMPPPPPAVCPDCNYLPLTVCYRAELSPLAATYTHYRWRERGEGVSVQGIRRQNGCETVN